MNVNEIMKNWKEYTNTENVKEYSDKYDSNEYEMFESEDMIIEFCEYYKYNSEIRNYLFDMR